MRSPCIIKALFGFALLTIHCSVFAETSRDDPIVGHSEGNHRLDCTIVRPWGVEEEPAGPYPVIGWANGWGQGNVFGDGQVEHYIDGVTKWAEDGDYFVAAANQWSARSPDVLQCLQWLIDESWDPDSEYFETVNTSRIGLSGHSQGGGAALKAGPGILQDGLGFALITTVVAMNPYGPSFVKARGQNGQIMLLGGAGDTVTPTDSFSAVLDDSVLSNDKGGLQAELAAGTHCNPVCPHPDHPEFGIFGEVAFMWWQMFLSDMDKCDELKAELNMAPKWDTQYSDAFLSICPG